MAGPPREVDRVAGDGLHDDVLAAHVVVGDDGMHHERQMGPEPRPALEEHRLAAAVLLRGGAEHDDGEVELVGEGGEGEARSDRGGRDEVVAAAVTDLREGVVLGAQHHPERPVTGDALDRRREPVGAARDDVPAALERVCDRRGGVMLGERRLGASVDAAAQRHEFVVVRVDLGVESCGQVVAAHRAFLTSELRGLL